MERFSPSTTVSVKAYPMCIFTSCLAREMMASEGSFGRDNTTKMKQPSSICRKHFDLPLPGSALPDLYDVSAHYSLGRSFANRIALVSVSHVVQTSIIDRADGTIYIMRTMQFCLVELQKMASTVKTA